MPASDEPAESLSQAPDEVLGLAVAAEPTSFGAFTMAAAGGDRLSRERPGSVVLFEPSYEYNARVPHLGHRSSVTAVAFRHDGKQFVSGDAAGVLKIWNPGPSGSGDACPGNSATSRIGRMGGVAVANQGRH
jgi:hypothetical protein